jgi:hypothetical protein
MSLPSLSNLKIWNAERDYGTDGNNGTNGKLPAGL